MKAALSVNFEATAGTTYYFMVGTFGLEGGGGNLIFTVDVGGPPFVLEAFDVDETGSVNPKAGKGR